MTHEQSIALSEMAKLVSSYATDFDLASSEEEAEQALSGYLDAYRRFVAACRQYSAHPDWYFHYSIDKTETA